MATPKISFTEFNILCEKGLIFNGFVDTVGYVYWTAEILYFIKIFDSFKNKIYYEQVTIAHTWTYRKQGVELVRKTKYNLHVILLDALEISNKRLYNEYFNNIPPLKTDAIKIHQSTIGSGANTDSKVMNTISAHARDVDAITKPLSELDNAVGEALDIAGVASGVKKIPLVGDILAGASIISNIADGDYHSAGGEALRTFSGWYGATWDIGVAIYESDNYIIGQYHQTKAAMLYWKKNRNQMMGETNYQTYKKTFDRAEENYNQLIESRNAKKRDRRYH